MGQSHLKPCKSHLEPCMHDEDIEKIPVSCDFSYHCENEQDTRHRNYLWAPPEWENERQYVFDGDSTDKKTLVQTPVLPTREERQVEEYLKRHQHLIDPEPPPGPVEDSRKVDEANARAANETKLIEEAKQKAKLDAIEEAKAIADVEEFDAKQKVEAKAIEEAKAKADADDAKAKARGRAIGEARAKTDVEELKTKQAAEVKAIEAKAKADAEELKAKQEAEAKGPDESLLGPLARPGAAVMVLLDNGSWVVAGEDEQSQVRAHLSAGETKFAMVSRGAMYMMDFTNMEAPTQTNVHTKKARTLKISS